MKDKLKTLAMMYTIPFISMIVFAFGKTVELNGEHVGLPGLMLIGFIVGVCLEGFLFIMSVTGAVLMGKI